MLDTDSVTGFWEAVRESLGQHPLTPSTRQALVHLAGAGGSTPNVRPNFFCDKNNYERSFGASVRTN